MSSAVPFDDVRAILTAWEAQAQVPVRWPNEPFTRPAEAPYVSVGMGADAIEPIELGPAGGWRETGYVLANIHVPAGHGTRIARVLGKDIANLFRGRITGPVTYHRANIGDGEPDFDNAAWWVLTVTVDYRYTDTVA